MRLLPNFDRITLSYCHRTQFGDSTSHEYAVLLDSTPCHYGGERYWFLCPADNCSRRVAVLYGGEVFACRHCYGLSYDSQREPAYSRALTRAQAIRETLSGTSNMEDRFPGRPKGMHFKTYVRLFREYAEAQERSWAPWMLRLIS